MNFTFKSHTPKSGHVLVASVAVVVVGCSSPQSAPTGVERAIPQVFRSSSSYRVIHRFYQGAAAQRPFAGLINVGGTLYGSTFGPGTVFSLSTTGAHNSLHRFNSKGASGPWDAPLLDVNGTLYGTTYYKSVVFSVTTDGVERTVHRFTGDPDGAAPWAGLIDVGGNLYGTTSAGGTYCGKPGCGTVFVINASGAEKVLHSFGGESDGVEPGSALLDVNGTLYGTTADGGANGNGCVYSISTSGAEKVLYSFAGKGDGQYPIAPLIELNGTLYGTTLFGGASGDGTVFSITTSGKEKLLYSFAGGSDGDGPGGPVLNVHGTLYGLTDWGGISSCSASGYSGCGTIYSVTTDGTEKVLYGFTGGKDGAMPQDGLVNVNGTLYGTTIYGGSSGCQGLGCGTVFSLTP